MEILRQNKTNKRRKSIAVIFIFSSYNHSSITPLVQFYLWEPRSKAFSCSRKPSSENGSMFVADAIFFASLPLQFDFRESSGSLFLQTSHCRGLHLNEYVWALQASASDGSTTRQSTWKWLPQCQRDQRFFSTPSMSPRFGDCTWRFCGYNRTKSPDRPRHMAILSGKVELQQPAQ